MNNKEPSEGLEESKEDLYNYVKDHYWSARNFSASTLSSTCRQLGLGIGGICWLIKSSNTNCPVSFTTNLILILLVLFFVFDAIQYLTSLLKYQDLADQYDEKISNNEITEIRELIEPKNINYLSNSFFILKLFVLSLSALLFIYLLIKI